MAGNFEDIGYNDAVEEIKRKEKLKNTELTAQNMRQIMAERQIREKRKMTEILEKERDRVIFAIKEAADLRGEDHYHFSLSKRQWESETMQVFKEQLLDCGFNVCYQDKTGMVCINWAEVEK